MRSGPLPSTTASIVASARGAAGVDPVAAELVPPGFALLARARGRAARLVPFADGMRLRTMAIDAAIETAARDGVRQLVVLGAGLCARAWRMHELAETTVFEVDHPSTQRYKRRRLADRPACSRAVTFVPIDFEREDLANRLEEAGHDRGMPTTWIWEGVTMYLTREALEGTLACIRGRSGAGSVAIVTYATRPRRTVHRALHRLADPVMRVLGEPFIGLLDTEELAALLRAQGFEVREDVGYADLARRYALPAPRSLVAERIVVATVS